MNNLTSRAAVIEYLMTNMGWHDEDGYEVDDADEKRTIITDLVNGIPAVDAIPVEWIENMLQHWLKGSATLEMCLGITEMLHMWQKEQEGNDD